MSEDNGVLDGGTRSDRSCLRAADEFFDASVKIVVLACCNLVGGRDALLCMCTGKEGVKFCAEFCLDGLVCSEEFDDPEERGRGRVVACDKKAEELKAGIS
jgi:hypothetical protein